MILFAAILFLIVSGLAALHFVTRLRRLTAISPGLNTTPSAGRYNPMMRLLSTDDAYLVASNKPLAKKFRKQRVAIFRDYLCCLTRDYGRLLAGVRLAMVRSQVDRPDLAAALARNQALFALAVCRIEYRLWLHSAGIGTVDVSAVVAAMDALRTQAKLFTPVSVGAH
ncbi:MAG: hypothetical protein ABUS49_02290 [Acidobacteriota bacterium]